MNPFVSGKIVGVNYFQDIYLRMEGGKRGKKDFVMSRSELMEFDHCPQRWLRGVEEDPDDRAQEKSTIFGNLVDCIITQPSQVKNLFAVVPSEYVNDDGETKKWNFNAKPCIQWKAANEGKTHVKAPMQQDALQAEARLQQDKRISELIGASNKQVCITTLYQSDAHKFTVPVKVLIDFVPQSGEHTNCLADLKTARNAEPRKWQRQVFDLNYYVQAAMYLDAYNSCPNAAQRDSFLHVIVENVKPFEPARRQLSVEFIELGRARYIAAMERYCDCLATGNWPGFDDEGNNIVNGWRVTEPEPWMIK